MLNTKSKLSIVPMMVGAALLTVNPALAGGKKVPAAVEKKIENAATVVGKKITSSQIAKNTIKNQQNKFSDAEKRAIENTIAALNETRNTIDALDKNNGKLALSHLGKAIGKVEVALAIAPDMALVPVDVKSEIFDTQVDVASVKKALAESVRLLKEGRLQEARPLIAGLSSEIIISVSNVPLGAYPDAIKLVIPMIEKGKLKEAKEALLLALTTLVVEDHVVPLPIVRAEAFLLDAEKLAEKAGRSVDEEKQLSKLLSEARAELELGEVLGYGTAEEFKSFYKHIAEISEKTADGKNGDGFFNGIKKTLKELRQKIF